MWVLSAHPKDTEQVEDHVEAVDRRPGEEEDDADSDQDAADHDADQDDADSDQDAADQGCQNSEWC